MFNLFTSHKKSLFTTPVPISKEINPAMDTTIRLRCQLLELPRELRDEIYHYAFVFDKYDEHIDLYREATPPSKSLCFTSRQVYNESRTLYRKAFRSFWTDTSFVVHLTTFADWVSAWSLDEENVNNIKHITVSYEDSSREEGSNFFRLHDGGKSWEWPSVLPNMYGVFVIGIPSTRKTMLHDFAADDLSTEGPARPILPIHVLEAAIRDENDFSTAPSMAEQLKYLSEFTNNSCFRCWWNSVKWA